MQPHRYCVFLDEYIVRFETEEAVDKNWLLASFAQRAQARLRLILIRSRSSIGNAKLY